MAFLPALLIALLASAGVAALSLAVMRWRRRARLTRRVLLLEREWRTADQSDLQQAAAGPARLFAGQVGGRLARRFPEAMGALARRVDRAGLAGGIATVELLGWKVVCAAFGAGVGIWAIVRYGAVGVLFLIAGVLVGWFGTDVVLARYYAQRRRAILRDLPTVMDLLVLSLQAGMALDRALRTVIDEYHSALSEEVRRVLRDVDLGVSRGHAFEEMARRVDLDEVRSLSRAIVQSEELGVSLVTVMRTQSREVRLARRRAAEAEALRAPVKMLIPLVVFILPTLFMLLLGPVALRAAAALGGIP